MCKNQYLEILLDIAGSYCVIFVLNKKRKKKVIWWRIIVQWLVEAINERIKNQKLDNRTYIETIKRTATFLFYASLF